MKRCSPLLTLIGLFLFIVFPDVVLADNCGSLTDCFNTQRAAVAATVGLGIFATLLSIGLNFVPVVGQVKGIIEAITGEDLITGEKLETWERAMNLVPFGSIGKLGRIGDILDSGGDLGKGLRHTDDVDELVNASRTGSADLHSGGSRDDIDGTGAGHPRGDPRPDDAGGGPRRSPEDAPERPPDAASSGTGGGSKPPHDNGSGHGNRGDDGDGPDNPRDEGGSGNRDGDGSGDADKSNDGKKDEAGDEAAQAERKRLKQEMAESPSSNKWGTLDDGTNQGVKHFADYWEKYPDRIPSLAKRLGVDPANFENSAQGFKNFTAQAERVTTSDMVREVNGKSIHYLDGAANPKKGIVVIVKDGKIQSMMPSDPKSFNKLQ